jgi:Domain of unknown function (DUF4158)
MAAEGAGRGVPQRRAAEPLRPYTGDPDQAQLDRYFHLDTADRDLVDIRRGEHNRLGFAVQLGTVRFLGAFLADPTEVPWAVAAHLAAQLGIADPGVLKQYAAREGTNRLHAGERSSTLDRLRRLEEIRAVSADSTWASVPPGRLEATEWVTAPTSTPPARSPADSEDGPAGCNHRTGPRHQSCERGPTTINQITDAENGAEAPSHAPRPGGVPVAASPMPTASTAAARLLRPPTGPADAPSRAPPQSE